MGTCPGGAAPPLVSSAISHRAQATHSIKCYKKDVKLTTSGFTPNTAKVSSPRAEINSFSQKSKARLRFVAANSDQPLISQICLTYHQQIPSDGPTCKRHLDTFLKVLRRLFPGLVYLWVLEFQKRGAPHFHLFLSIPPDLDLQKQLASRWTQITGETPEHERFHAHPSNWIGWDMGNGSYLCKYLDKAAQKDVPADFHDVGRFWGCCRNMATLRAVIDASTIAEQDSTQCPQVDPLTGEIIPPSKRFFQLRRALKRYQYAQLRRNQTGKRLQTIAKRCNLIIGGALILPRLEAYYTASLVPF